MTVGEPDRAIDILDHLLSRPSGMTVALLKTQPFQLFLGTHLCRVSLVHRMETNVAHQPSRSFVCRLHSFPRWSFFISADSALQGNDIFDRQVESSPLRLRSGRYRRVLPMG
jgi:hypothetical protein